MNFIDISGVLFSILLSALHGAVLGVLNPFFYRGINFIFSLPEAVKIRGLTLRNVLTSLPKPSERFNTKQRCGCRSLCDFLYVFIYGFSVILLLYVINDGVFRIYPILFSLLLCRLSMRLLSPSIGKALDYILGVLLNILRAIIFIFSIPLRLLRSPVERLFAILQKKAAQHKLKAKRRKQKNMRNIKEIDTFIVDKRNKTVIMSRENIQNNKNAGKHLKFLDKEKN